ncbi:unnamed protein product, partial [Didymodactylos carnosus]
RSLRVPFEQYLALSKFSQKLKYHVEPNAYYDNGIIDNVIHFVESMEDVNMKHSQKIKTKDNIEYYYYQLILNDRILFPTGISKSEKQAKQLAYKNMMEICCYEYGVKIKPLVNHRYKVTKRSNFPKHDDDDYDHDITSSSSLDAEENTEDNDY